MADNSKEKSKDFMNFIFDSIKHGDDKHQIWLKDKCVQLESALEEAFLNSWLDGWHEGEGES